jgi:hypothetical protein
MSIATKQLVATIDYPHQRIHDGKAFLVNSYDTDIDIAGPKYYRITVPVGKVAHVEVDATLLTAGLVELYEGPTLTGAGTALTAINRNRESSNVAAVVVAEDCTISAAGTLLGFLRVNGSAHPTQGVGANAASRHEFELDAGNYLIKITTDADNNKSWLGVLWYEED